MMLYSFRQARATMLRSNVAIVWWELANAVPAMLGYVVLYEPLYETFAAT